MEEIARVYSQSLFDVAKEHDKLDRIRDELAEFADALEQNRELAVFFFSPYFSTEEKEAGLKRAIVDADPTFVNFLELLIEKHRVPVIFRVRRQFDTLYDREHKRLPVEVTSAVELDDAVVRGARAAHPRADRSERAAREQRSTRTSSAASCCGSGTRSWMPRSGTAWNSSDEKWRRPPEPRTTGRDMQIKPDEITNILKSRIEGLDVAGADLAEVGTVLSVADGIARVHGLENCMSFELLEFPHDVTGLALNLESDNVGVVLFGEWEKIVEGDTVKRSGHLLDIPVGEGLLGRIVDPLGKPLDGKGPIDTTETRPAEFKAPGVVQRQPVKVPVQTGLKAIDAMIPIGRGQRELIIGDRQTGKTAIAIDTIINNRDTGVVSVYVAIGQRMSTVVQLAEVLAENGALENTIIVAASADEAAPIKFMAPYAGCAMGEYFLYGGREALCRLRHSCVRRGGTWDRSVGGRPGAAGHRRRLRGCRRGVLDCL